MPRRPERKATLRLDQRHLTYLSMGVVLLVVIPLAIGVYQMFQGFKGQRDTVIAQDNLHNLYNAMRGYSLDYDGKLPPANEWTDVTAGYLSAPPNKPGGKLAYLHGPGDGEDVSYVYNDMASNYNLEPAHAFPGTKQAQTEQKPTIDPSRLILLIEKPGAQPNEHVNLPLPDNTSSQEALYKLLFFPHNQAAGDGAKTVVLYADGHTMVFLRSDLKPRDGNQRDQ